MTENDKVTVILNSIRKYFLSKFRVCSSSVSIANKYIAATVIDELGLGYNFVNYGNDESALENEFKKFFTMFNNEITYQIQYAKGNDSFKLIQIFIDDNANLDAIIGLLKLNNVLDTSVKSLFM